MRFAWGAILGDGLKKSNRTSGGALHDLVDFQRLFAKRAQDIFSIIQHDPTTIPSALDQ